MTVELPENAGYALRHAPPEQQKRILAILAEWPSNVGQSTPSYSRALHEIVGELVGAWGGMWLNPDEGGQCLKLQCANGHTWTSTPSTLRQGIWCSDCYVDSVRDFIADMHKLAAQHGGKCLSQTYTNSREKLQWQCKEGHTWEKSPNAMRKGTWCAQCRTNERQAYHLKEIHDIAAQKGGKCLSEKYTHNQAKLTFQCNEGHVWQTTPAIIKSAGAWCPVCFRHRRKLSLTHLHELAAAKGGLCLAKEYTTMEDKVQWQCAKGHIWKAEGVKIQLGTWCPQCAKDDTRLTIEEMQEIAHSRGGKCLSTHYKNSATKLLWECRLGHTWSAVPSSIKMGTWCPSCAFLSRSKREKTRAKYLQNWRKVLDAAQEQEK